MINKKTLGMLTVGASVAGLILVGGLGQTAALAETETDTSFGQRVHSAVVDASERFQRHGLSSKGDLLGLSAEELSARMEDQTFSEILEEEGISMEEFHAKRNAEISNRWRDRGLTEEEINARLEQLEARRGECDGENRFQGSPFGKGRNR
jgi:hypothetical protein